MTKPPPIDVTLLRAQEHIEAQTRAAAPLAGPYMPDAQNQLARLLHGLGFDNPNANASATHSYLATQLAGSLVLQRALAIRTATQRPLAAIVEGLLDIVRADTMEATRKHLESEQGKA